MLRCHWRFADLDEKGQSTVEAAVLLPVAMVVLALLLQPAMLLYTRAVMSGAAAEGARLATTATQDEMGSLVDGYVRRRLKAVPDIACFHAGGADAWEVEAESDGARVRVSVRGHARPLPLVGVTAGLVGQMDGGDVLLSAEVEKQKQVELNELVDSIVKKAVEKFTCESKIPLHEVLGILGAVNACEVEDEVTVRTIPIQFFSC